MRIVSLLPSATEIAFGLGLGDDVVGVTHECDYPPEARLKPCVTTTTLDTSLSSREIDAITTGHLADGTSAYRLDTEALRALEPDLVLTQMLCEVCAVPHTLVRESLPHLASRPKVLSLEPVRLADVLSNVKTVGDHTGHQQEARGLIAGLRDRIDTTALDAAARGPMPRVFCMEWLDPPWSAGHWVPDMVGLAGGMELLGCAAEPSRRVTWDEIDAVAPEVIVLMPCGFDLERTVAEFRRTELPEIWSNLPAVQAGRVFAVDGSAYFNRPGPRLVDGLEMLAEIFRGESAEQAGRWARLL